MSRKHYRLFAQMIAEADYLTYVQKQRLANDMSRILKADNPAFDKEKFVFFAVFAPKEQPE